MKHLIALAAALALTACASKAQPPPEVRYIEKAVPVATPCVSDKTAAAPSYPDTDVALKGASGPAERYGLISAGRLLRNQRLAEIEPVISACRR